MCEVIANFKLYHISYKAAIKNENFWAVFV